MLLSLAEMATSSGVKMSQFTRQELSKDSVFSWLSGKSKTADS